ncbi:MAG: hypothetical protein ACT4PT_03910 [Methanobacteriota archaeon]
MEPTNVRTIASLTATMSLINRMPTHVKGGYAQGRVGEWTIPK